MALGETRGKGQYLRTCCSRSVPHHEFSSLLAFAHAVPSTQDAFPGPDLTSWANSYSTFKAHISMTSSMTNPISP